MIDLPKNSETAAKYLSEILKVSISDFNTLLFNQISSRLNKPNKKTWKSIFRTLLKFKLAELDPTYLL